MCRSRPSLTTTFAMPSSSAIRNGTAPKTSPASLPKRSGLSKWLLITRVMFSAGTTTMSLTSCSQQPPPQAREVLTMVERFELDFHGPYGEGAYMAKTETGEFVRYSDYAALEEKLAGEPVAWGEFYGGKIVAVSLHK